MSSLCKRAGAPAHKGKNAGEGGGARPSFGAPAHTGKNIPHWFREWLRTAGSLIAPIRMYLLNALLAIVFFCTSCDTTTIIPDSIPGTFRENDATGIVHFVSSAARDHQGAFWEIKKNSFYSSYAKIRMGITKTSGYPLADIGIIFCYQNRKNFAVLTINLEGEYSIRKQVAGEYTVLREWQEDENLLTGYGVENVITVELINHGEYGISFNNVPVSGFSDSSFNSGGAIGYFVYVAGREHEVFPFEPVRVEFRVF
ncbi:MAG: hypothetical protein ACR2PY_04330 [Salinispira sp.]